MSVHGAPCTEQPKLKVHHLRQCSLTIHAGVAVWRVRSTKQPELTKMPTPSPEDGWAGEARGAGGLTQGRPV